MREVNIHASCVAIGSHGVLLLGPSGAGKSSLALQLIDAGARLVADDRTILTVKAGALQACAPATIKGLIEIYGVGIIRMPVRPTVRLALAVALGPPPARLPAPAFHEALDVKLPQVTLEARDPATPARIRAILAAQAQGLFRDTFVPK